MEFKGKIEFYEKEIAFSIPENFDNFLKKISEMIDFKEEELLQKISLSYKDNEGDEVSLNSKDDYDAFIIYLKENDNILTTIILELKGFSEDLINKIHQKMKIHKEKVPEEKNFNINEFEFNNKINENIMDDYKINKDDFQDDILIVEDNDKNINEINQINDKYDYNENDFKNVNQFNNNFYNNDDINIIHSFQENNNNHNSISNNKSVIFVMLIHYMISFIIVTNVKTYIALIANQRKGLYIPIPFIKSKHLNNTVILILIKKMKN